MAATCDASRPNVWPSASTTYHARFTSAVLITFVFIYLSQYPEIRAWRGIKFRLQPQNLSFCMLQKVKKGHVLVLWGQLCYGLAHAIPEQNLLPSKNQFPLVLNFLPNSVPCGTK